MDTSVAVNAALGSGAGFALKLFSADGLQTYQADGTIDFALGVAGHDVNIGVTIDDVRGQFMSDYIDPSIAALMSSTARFSNDITKPALLYSAPYRSIGDRYKVNFGTDSQNCAVNWVDNSTNCNVSINPATNAVRTALSQLISPIAAPVVLTGYAGYSVAVTGLLADTVGTAVWTDNAGVQANVTTQWDIRTVHGVEMLYIPTPTVTSKAWRNDRIGVFFTIIQGVVAGRGDHLASGINPITRAVNGKFNMDSVASGNQTFNKTAINDINAALGLNPLP
ncbi:MAG: hypothetical protein Q9M19_08840 [Mariprofundaceae bacterium]|nr:hypothetical protein [Mariprofundaceae bacterium]